MGTAESFSCRFRTSAFDGAVSLEVERKTGPSVSDYLHVFTVEQAKALSDALLQSIEDTVPRDAPSEPTPTADLAQHLYGLPYGEEFTT